MDLSRLSTATKVITGAAIVLFIIMFFDWGTFDPPGPGSFGQNGWHGFLGVVLGILLIALIAWQVVKILGVKLPELPATDRQIELGVIAGVVVFGVLKVLTTSDVSVSGVSAGDRVWWVQILALILLAAIAWGGWQRMSEAEAAAPAAPATPAAPAAPTYTPPAPAAADEPAMSEPAEEPPASPGTTTY
jgi:hypothetical protein